MNIGTKDGRDRNFVCAGCGGNIVEVGIDKGRVLYDCDKCRSNPLMACTVCRLPRSVWADAGEICGLCYFRALQGDFQLTKEQIAKIETWKVIVQRRASR